MVQKRELQKLLRCFFAGCALAAAFAGRSECAGSLSQTVISSFPRDVSELAYSDFAQARKYPWFAQFKRQTLPTGFGEIERFLASAGITPDHQIDEIAWALMATDDPVTTAQNATPPPPGPKSPAAQHHKLPGSDDLIAIVLGQFDTAASEALLEKNNISSVQWRGRTLYACGSSCHDFYFVFLDSGTLAFGKILLLEHMLQVRSGSEESVLSNPVLFPLIHKVNSGGLFWGVLNDSGTAQALHQLVPEAGNFPDVAKLIRKMQAMTVVIEGDDTLNAELEVSADAQDAASLAQLMEAGLLLKQFQASQEDPQFAKILQNVTVVASGPGVRITFEVSSEQMVSLIQHNTFSPKI